MLLRRLFSRLFNRKTSKKQAPIIEVAPVYKETFEKIREIVPTKVNLIDFENVNVSDVILPIIQEDKTLNVFFYNENLQTKKYQELTDGKSNCVAITIKDPQNQLVDQLLTNLMTAILDKVKGVKISIVSLDKGYEKLLSIYGDSRVSVYDMSNYQKRNAEKFRYRIFKYMQELENTRRIDIFHEYPEADIRYFFTKFYQRKGKYMNEKKFRNIITTLEENSILTVGKDYYYSFHFDKLAKVLKQMECECEWIKYDMKPVLV